MRDDARGWAKAEMGEADLGDERLRRRVVEVLARIAETPGGRITQVVKSNAELQGAYDLLANAAVTRRALGDSMANACWQRCLDLARGNALTVVVPFDGTAIGVPDHGRTKSFGAVGSYSNGGRGLQVMTALALTTDGTPIGVPAQRFWSRPVLRPRRMRTHWRKTSDKETQQTLELLRDVQKGAAVTCALRLLFVGDRGYDAGPLLTALATSGHDFIIRACRDRRTATEIGERQHRYLRQRIAKSRPLGGYRLHVRAGYGRQERVAIMEVRATRVTLVLRDAYAKKEAILTLSVVQTRERRTTPHGEKPLDWTLLTNVDVTDLAQAIDVVDSYALRWRIEEFHRTWKTGACNVEGSRLHSPERLEKWATLLAAVAARIERMKQLSREMPEQAASIELTTSEIAAIVWLKRKHKKRNELVSDAPTMAEAVKWIAEIGGYTGYGGPPGTITITRGFARISALAEYLRDVNPQPEKAMPAKK